MKIKQQLNQRENIPETDSNPTGEQLLETRSPLTIPARYPVHSQVHDSVLETFSAHHIPKRVGKEEKRKQSTPKDFSVLRKMRTRHNLPVSAKKRQKLWRGKNSRRRQGAGLPPTRQQEAK
ncbi:hypothetical protein TNCT_555081 [Trichonephila clavata]|uniref:Uncharacterized protein n=1 Tax=Trichonephila clavata TaxID=2740835 RepID=A0A8X6KX16_TRICU|nr:hypothetical protein TNCT_555081 [Trichonephila clavata]